jgi:hypothetical protein
MARNLGVSRSVVQDYPREFNLRSPRLRLLLAHSAGAWNYEARSSALVTDEGLNLRHRLGSNRAPMHNDWNCHSPAPLFLIGMGQEKYRTSLLNRGVVHGWNCGAVH